MKKDYVLLSSIKKFGVVPGKKALHKINYFINLKTDLFIYEWSNWGPFSQEVRQFYDDAYLENIISVNEGILGNSSIQYNIQLDQKGFNTLKNLENDLNLNKETIDNAINFSYELLKDMTPRQMEILASVHYINSYDNSLNADRIWKIINRLKPTANFSLDDVKVALEKLKEKKLLK